MDASSALAEDGAEDAATQGDIAGAEADEQTGSVSSSGETAPEEFRAEAEVAEAQDKIEVEAEVGIPAVAAPENVPSAAAAPATDNAAVAPTIVVNLIVSGAQSATLQPSVDSCARVVIADNAETAAAVPEAEAVPAVIDEVEPDAEADADAGEADRSVAPDEVTFDDIKGLHEAKQIVRDALINPVLYPRVYRTLGVRPGSGMLLYGPPGTGKTMFGRAIANELKCEFKAVTFENVRGKNPQQTVSMISDLFNAARSCPQGCVLFFDDCEELLSRPGNSKAFGVSQFLNELDGIKSSPGSNERQVFVIIATNRPWLIDGALLRSGRISAAAYIGLPEEESRMALLRDALKDAILADDVDLEKLAAMTEGYSGAEIWHRSNGGGICDLARISASRRWVRRIEANPAEERIPERICWQDFIDAMHAVTSSAVRDAERIRQNELFRDRMGGGKGAESVPANEK